MKENTWLSKMVKKKKKGKGGIEMIKRSKKKLG